MERFDPKRERLKIEGAWKAAVKTALPGLAIVLWLGCSRSDGNIVATPPDSNPPVGFYADCVLGLQGPWLSVAANEVVNVAVREQGRFPFSAEGPCGIQEDERVRFYAVFRGVLVTADSAAGPLWTIIGADSGITATGGFEAKWDGERWRVSTAVVASDGCRLAPCAASFEACK